MASYSKAPNSRSGSGLDSSASEVGSSCGCVQFGVRSYLHHFYESCSAESGLERPTDGTADVHTWRSKLNWSSGLWKAPLVLGVLLVTSGLVSLSVGYSSSTRIETFGEVDLLFIDTQAISINRGLHQSIAAGFGLTCLGCSLTATSTLLLSFSRKRRLFQKERKNEMAEGGTDGGAKASGLGEGRIPATQFNMEGVQPPA